MSKLFLFDIDNTLIRSEHSHSASFSFCFEKIYNIQSDIDIINHSWMIDMEIIVEVLRKKGLKDNIIFKKIKLCMDCMCKYFKKVKDNIQIEIIDWVIQFLEYLKEKDVVLGLVTGNLECIANIKLRKVGLDKYFKIWAFGSDSFNRSDLVKIAIKRVYDRYWKIFKLDNIFLIWDTPRDIQAGKMIGVKTIWVTTGLCSRKDLILTGAARVVSNLWEIKFDNDFFVI